MRHVMFQHELARLGVPFKKLQKIEHERTTQKIIRESAKVIIFCSVLSSIGGLGLEAVQTKLLVFLPFLILLPAMNDLVGSFGATISARFSTMLYLKHFTPQEWMHSRALHRLFLCVMTVGAISSIIMASLAYGIAFIQGFPFHVLLFIELLSISLFATLLLTVLLFFVSIAGGIYVHKHGHDPDNYLIPLTTAIGDLGCMLIITGVLAWLL